MAENKVNSPREPALQSRRRLGSRAALIVGFGALLVLMAIIGIDSVGTLRAFETSNIQVRRDFVYRERTLEQVRSALYETGNMVRDYLLIESDSHSREMLQAQFRSIRDETTAALKAGIESLPEAQRVPFQHLAVELENNWSSLGQIFELGAKDKRGAGNSLLNRNVLSEQVAILAITKEVSAVNDEELKEADQRIGEMFELFRHRFLMVGTIASALGMILATTTIVYVGRLEKSVEEKYFESLQAQGELKQLSKRLVDAEERERRAISRELHDEVGQLLSALLLDVESLTEMAGQEKSFRQRLQSIKTLAENCVNEVRNMALLLRPSMLDDLGLIPALEWQAREVSKRTGMLVDTMEENVSEDLPEEHKTSIYRIVQEALNNCSKHAHAKNVRVVVRQEPNHLQLSIEDDGKGFEPSRARGLGLIGMKERVSQLGGVLKVDSDPARGTRLRVDLPLPGLSAGEKVS